MKMSKTLLAMAVLGVAASGAANADAIIYNTGDATTATVALGVNDEGHLNVTAGNIAVNAGATGLATKFPDTYTPPGWHDATSPGCLCEGWGAAADGVFGAANESVGGIQNLTVDSFTSTASTATSVVHLTSLPGLEVTHAYQPSASSNLFEAVVTLSNTSAATLTDVRYSRAMDWDIPYNEFNEYVTIQGTATTSNLLYSSDNGFANPNPFASRGDLNSCGITTDFIDCGPDDHGAVFDFGFGDLAAGESLSFSIFYGAALSEAGALAALAEVGPELYSLGQSNTDPTGGTPATYIFAFKGVGGTVIVGEVPVPAPAALLGVGLIALAGMRKRKRA